MSEIRLTLISRQVLVTLEQRQVRLTFPRSIPPVELPDGSAPGDVLTWDGDSWEAEPPGAVNNLETWEAGENLSTGRAVIIEGGQAIYFQPSDPAHGGRAWGITKTSATAGNDVTIQREGVVTDVAFSGFADEALYIGDDGELQTSWPGSGLLQKAGIAAGSNKVKIDFSIQIQQI